MLQKEYCGGGTQQKKFTTKGCRKNCSHPSCCQLSTKSTKKNCYKHSGNESEAVNTELVVGADNKTFVTVSRLSSMIYRPLAQAAAAWSLDSFTEAFLPFPIWVGAMRPLNKQEVKCCVRASGGNAVGSGTTTITDTAENFFQTSLSWPFLLLMQP